MRIALLCILMLSCFSLLPAQIKTQINGNDVELKQATDGEVDLYYCVFEREYYYFIQDQSGQLIQLQQLTDEPNFYRAKLSELTGGYGNTNRVDYDLKSIQKYLNNYHQSKNSDYDSFKVPSRIAWHAALFGGVTNNPFVTNTDNIVNPMIQVEFEFSENIPEPRHSGIIQLRHAFESDDFEYHTTEFSLGYRYRFLRKDKFNLFGQVKLVTYNNAEITLLQEGETVTLDRSAFEAPFVFGLGADFKIGERSYISFIYSELFALFLDNQGNFPIDFALGYKIRL